MQVQNTVSKGVNQVGRKGRKEGRQFKAGKFVVENVEEGGYSSPFYSQTTGRIFPWVRSQVTSVGPCF